MVTKATKTTGPKVHEAKTASLRPEDKKQREKAYMENWPPKLQQQLRAELEQLAWNDMTLSERLFLDPKSLPKPGVVSPGTKRLQDMIISKRVGQGVIDDLASRKVQAVHNPTNKTIAIEVPGETGARLLISPPDGFWPITAYGSEFADPGAFRASGLRVVDYDPNHKGMNPPDTASGRKTADRRVTDPEFAKRIAEAKETQKADQLIRERPEILSALHAAMNER